MIARVRVDRIILLVACGILLAGCETVLEPSAWIRHRSGEGAPKIDDRGVFFLYSSDAPLTVSNFSGQGGTFKLSFDHPPPFSLSLASAFTKDGYLLTAGHSAAKHILVIGVMEGEVRAVSARVVLKKSFGNYGTDLAILHVDRSIDFPLPLGQFAAGERSVYAIGCEREPTLQIIVMGGKVRGAINSLASSEVQLLDTDLPSWHGDSGGGVVLPDGRLIGVITGFKTEWSALHNAKLVCAPNRALVESIVAADREAHR